MTERDANSSSDTDSASADADGVEIKPQRGRPKKSPIQACAQKVAFTYFRGHLDWPDIIDVARTLTELDWDSDNEKHLVSRVFYGYGDGKFGMSPQRLTKADKLIPGIKRLCNHPLWTLIERYETITHDKLISVIRELPPRLIPRLLADPNRTTGAVHPKEPVTDDDYYAVQQYGSLDAVAALYALALLFWRDQREEAAQQAAIAGTRLFLILSVSHNWLYAHGHEIWEFLKTGLLRVLAPNRFGEWLREISEYEVVEDTCRKLGAIGKGRQESLNLLLLIDHREYDELVHAAYSTWNDVMLNECMTEPLEKPLRNLISAYKSLQDKDPLPQIKPKHEPLSRISVEEAKAILDEFLTLDAEQREPK